MRVLFVTPEYAPLAKAGGLGDVSGALPDALRALGVRLDVLLPAYSGILEKTQPKALARFKELGFDCHLFRKDGLLLLDCPALYQRPGSPYADAEGRDWPDNPLRFGLLSKVAARLAAEYDVVHCHDWPAALTPVYGAGKTLLTIHNLAFQGNFEPSWLARLGLSQQLFTPQNLEFHGRLSFLKAGLVNATALNTVSPTYAREILGEEMGCGMQGVLQERGSALSGILNGIDTEVWNPATDAHLAQRYDAQTLDDKAANKEALRKRLNLESNEAPLLGFVGRLTHQKGADLIAAAAGELPAQLALLGTGERAIEDALREAAARHPGRIAVTIGFDEPLAHLIEAGADLFLMPSRFEPCGLNQMYSQRYGTPPVARATGGLADTVADGRTGFLFEGLDLRAAVERALAAWREPARWRVIQRAGMGRDFSWRSAARQYADLYSRLSRTPAQRTSGSA
jgi:starch synthase